MQTIKTCARTPIATRTKNHLFTNEKCKWNWRGHSHHPVCPVFFFCALPFFRLFLIRQPFLPICIKFKRATHETLVFNSISSHYNGQFIIAIWNKSQINRALTRRTKPVCAFNCLPRWNCKFRHQFDFVGFARALSESDWREIYNQLINPHGTRTQQTVAISMFQ